MFCLYLDIYTSNKLCFRLYSRTIIFAFPSEDEGEGLQIPLPHRANFALFSWISHQSGSNSNTTIENTSQTMENADIGIGKHWLYGLSHTGKHLHCATSSCCFRTVKKNWCATYFIVLRFVLRCLFTVILSVSDMYRRQGCTFAKWHQFCQF